MGIQYDDIMARLWREVVSVQFNPLFSLFPPPCSDWSRSVTVGGRGKKKTLVNSDSLASGDTSTTRKVSDTSTGSTLKNHQQGAWVGSGTIV